MSNQDVKIKVSLDGAETVQKGLKGVGDEASVADTKVSALSSRGFKGVAIGAAAVGAGVAFMGKGLWDLANNTGLAGDRIDEMSQKMGLSAKGYQQWDYIMSQNGGTIDALRGGLTRLNSSVDEAANGSTAAIDKFARLGITLDDLKGKSREEIFNLTVAGLQGVTDTGEKAAIATQLLGRSASELGPLLNSSAASVADLKQKSLDLGLVMSDQAVVAADAFRDSLATLQRTFAGVRNSIGAELLPGLIQVSDGLAGLLAGTAGSDEKIKAGAETLVASITTVLPRVLEVFYGVLGGVAVIAPQIISSLVAGIVSNLPTLTTTLSGAFVSLVLLLASQLPSIIASGAQAVAALITGISAALPQLIPAIVTGLLGMLQALIDAAPLLIAAGMTLISGLVTGLIDSLPVLIAALPAIITGIVTFLTTSIPVLLDAGVQLFTALVQALPAAITQIMAVLPTLITSILTAIIGAIPLLIQAGIQLLTALVTNLPAIITAIVAALPQIITAIITAVIGAIPQLIQAGIDLFIALVRALPQIIVAIVAAIPQIIGAVVGGVLGAIPQLISAGVQLLVALVRNMPLIVGTIVAVIPQIIGGIVGALASGIGQMVNMGSNLVRGIWEGISGAAGWLFNKIRGFASDVVGNIANFFGTHSPSTRLRDEVGQWIPAGIGVGVAENAQKALQPIQDLNSQIMTEALKLNTSADFTSTANLTQTLVPMRATATQPGPTTVQATLDPYLISSAITDSFAGMGKDQSAVSLSKDSISMLASAIVDSIRVQSRQGVSVLG